MDTNAKSEHRAGLRKQIEQRRQELQDAFDTAKKGNLVARRTELEVELTVVDNALTGGWDKVSEVAAEQLSRWLTTTQSLVPQGKTDPMMTQSTPAVPQPDDRPIIESASGISFDSRFGNTPAETSGRGFPR